ncbi:YdeI family protein [Hymenobacter sp. B81]|uniref:YdeI family protein n=1 Tax=Hymenobacter sp. B81 TaxID=3344878 RepID=UPI0037DC2F24
MPPKTSLTELPLVTAADRQQWRQWLEQHHASARGVWLVYHKKSSGRPSISWSEAVQEALCFGWIDSKANTLDAHRYKQVFTPRKPRSVWSKINKQHVENLRAAGLMRPAGERVIELAQQNGSWTAIDAAENLEVPADLTAALAVDAAAAGCLAALSPSRKKQLLQWLLAAKRPETRAKRLAGIVQQMQELVSRQARS